MRAALGIASDASSSSSSSSSSLLMSLLSTSTNLTLTENDRKSLFTTMFEDYCVSIESFRIDTCHQVNHDCGVVIFDLLFKKIDYDDDDGDDGDDDDDDDDDER